MTKHFRQALRLLLIVAGFAKAASAANEPDCDRQCLTEIADQYYQALAMQDPENLPFSPDVKYSENGSLVAIGEGHWNRSSGEETFRLQIFDPETGGIGTYAVFPTDEGLALMTLRLKVQAHLITEVESVVVYPNTGATHYAPENLTEPSYFWTWSIRATEQDNRHELIAAAESYFRAFETEGTPEYVRSDALLPDTMRVEMGVQTTTAGDRLPTRDDGRLYVTPTLQFDNAEFEGAEINNRRYPVVDTQTGGVLAMVRFGGATGRAVVGEFFAVTGGKIREIQAVFVVPEEPTTPVW